MITFTIPYPPSKRAKSAFCRRFGLNAYYSGKHWAQRQKDADHLHALTLLALRKSGVPKTLLECPVEVRFYHDDGLDVDNHAVIGKAVVDALKGYLLPNDNRRWLRKVSHEFWPGGAIKVEILPYPDTKKGTTTERTIST